MHCFRCLHSTKKGPATMPLYEYHCEPCGHAFETLVRSSSDVPRCPKCGNDRVAKQFSVPAASPTGSLGQFSPASASETCGRPQCGMGGCQGLG